MIKFGTDGWRAIIADDFTFANVRRVSLSVAEYILSLQEDNLKEGRQGIVIGYDARFLSKEFAHEAAAIIADKGIKVWLAEDKLPTPAVSWQVVDRRAVGGVVITASHNPPTYNGYKFKAYYGGSANDEIISEIEKRVQKYGHDGISIPKVSLSKEVEYFSAKKDYLQHIKDMLDEKSIKQYQGKIIFDMMHGSVQGYAKDLGKEYGLNLIELHGDVNPSFGGVNPEPAKKYLDKLKQAVLLNKADFALATDGDGDRIGAMSHDGEFISANQLMALLAKYLIEKKEWSGAIVKTITCSDLVVKVAEKYQRKLIVTPVGFKHIAELMVKEDILIGGEESGGIGIKNYIPERDGLLLGFLAIEMSAVYGKPLGVLLKELMDEVGYFYYAREDLTLKREKKERLMADLLDLQDEFIEKYKIKNYDKSDGVKLYLEGGGWVMFRASGTEPIVRIYAEAATKERLQSIMQDAMRYVQNA